MSKQHTRLPGNEDPDRRAATHAGAEGQDVAALPTEHLQTLARTLQKRHEELEAENEALRETRFELALARDRYYSLYEFAPVGYLTLDSDGRIVEANITAATILGVERQELIGKPLTHWIEPDAENGFCEHIETARQQRKRTAYEVSFPRPDGAPLFCRLTTSLCEDGTAAFWTTLTDITSHRETEAALRRSSELSGALNRINQALHATLDMNEIMARLVGEGVSALASDTGAISLREGDGWVVNHVYGLPASLVGARIGDEEARHALLAFTSGEPVAVPDAFNDPRFNREHLRRHNIRAVLVAPLFACGDPVGVIFFNYHAAPHTFTEQEVIFARQLAAAASSALENARLFEERERAQEALHRLNDTLEERVAERTALAQQRTDELQSLAAVVSEIEERERARVAHLLHDDMQQLLVAARFQLGRIKRNKHDAARFRQGWQQTEALLTECAEKCRELSHELVPRTVAEGSLHAALEALRNEMKVKYGLHVALDIAEEAEPSSQRLRLILFRAARELLFNVIKHAGAQKAEAAVGRDKDLLSLTVIDHGKGFDPSTLADSVADTGIGLFGLRQRIQMLGGTVRIDSAPGHGCVVEIRVPDAASA